MLRTIQRVLRPGSFHVRAMLTVLIALTTSVTVAFAAAGGAGTTASGSGSGSLSSPSGYGSLSSGASGPGAIDATSRARGNGISIGPISVGVPQQVQIGGVRFLFGESYEQDFEQQACNVLGLSRGKFAALVMVTSGLIALISAATGAYRIALATLVVGVGSSILQDVVELFFGQICPEWIIRL